MPSDTLLLCVLTQYTIFPFNFFPMSFVSFRLNRAVRIASLSANFEATIQIFFQNTTEQRHISILHIIHYRWHWYCYWSLSSSIGHSPLCLGYLWSQPCNGKLIEVQKNQNHLNFDIYTWTEWSIGISLLSSRSILFVINLELVMIFTSTCSYNGYAVRVLDEWIQM